MGSLFGVIIGENMAKIYRTWLKYIERKFVYKVNTKTNLRRRVITAKEIDFNPCQLALLTRK